MEILDALVEMLLIGGGVSRRRSWNWLAEEYFDAVIEIDWRRNISMPSVKFNWSAEILDAIVEILLIGGGIFRRSSWNWLAEEYLDALGEI